MGARPSDVDPAQATLAGLFAQHRPRLRAILRRLGVGDANLDDAVQDVFVVLVRRIEEHDGADEGSLQAWLRGIARRIASNHRRGATRASKLRTQLATEVASTTTDDVDHFDTAAVLQSFLDVLTPEQCEAFVLGEVHGLTGPEIAARLGIPLDTAYSRLRAARRELQRTVTRVRAREHRAPRSAALAFLPRLATGVAQMHLFAPAILIAANVAAASVQLAAQTPAGDVPVVPSETRDCVVAPDPTSTTSSADDCAERHQSCRTRVDACRGALTSCERDVLERLPLDLRFEALPPSAANEARIEELIARVSEESGSELELECHGEICLVTSTTTDEVQAARRPEKSPNGLLRTSAGYGTEIIGMGHESGSPSTDLASGDGIWITRIWIVLADEEVEAR